MLNFIVNETYKSLSFCLQASQLTANKVHRVKYSQPNTMMSATPLFFLVLLVAVLYHDVSVDGTHVSKSRKMKAPKAREGGSQDVTGQQASAIITSGCIDGFETIFTTCIIDPEDEGCYNGLRETGGSCDVESKGIGNITSVCVDKEQTIVSTCNSDTKDCEHGLVDTVVGCED